MRMFVTLQFPNGCTYGYCRLLNDQLLTVIAASFLSKMRTPAPLSARKAPWCRVGVGTNRERWGSCRETSSVSIAFKHLTVDYETVKSKKYTVSIPIPTVGLNHGLVVIERPPTRLPLRQRGAVHPPLKQNFIHYCNSIKGTLLTATICDLPFLCFSSN